MQIKRLLVPTDFSENAERALTYALDLAKRCAGSLQVLHVPVIPTYPLLESAYATTPDVTRRILANAQQALDSLAPRLRREGIPYELKVEEGVPHKAIGDFALRHRADLVVMGTHGRTSIQKVMYGSVTARALRTLPTPTIVVPQEGGKPPHTIVIAYDFSAAANRAAEVARALHELYRGPLHLVHAYTDAVPDEKAEARERALRIGLNEMLDEAAAQLFRSEARTVQNTLIAGDPAKRVLDVARQVGADLICAGTTGKGGIARLLLGSVARQLVNHSTLPVLLTHAEQ